MSDARRLIRGAIKVALLLALCAAVAGQAQANQAASRGASNALTNQDIIKMVSAGVSESIVDAAIRSAKQRDFDLTPDGLIALKRAGVADSIVTVMQSTTGPIRSAQIPPAAPAPAGITTQVPRPSTNSNPRATLPPSHSVEAPGASLVFSLDNTRDEVIRAQGKPDSESIDGHVMFYGTSRVYLEGGRVARWALGTPALRVHDLENIRNLRNAYVAKAAEAEQVKAKAGGQPPASLTELQQNTEAVQLWEANLRERITIMQELMTAGESIDGFDADAEMTIIEARRNALVLDRLRFDVGQLNAEFKELEKRKPALLDAYTRAFGTPAQRDSASQLLDHLRRMQANRLAAQKAGQLDAAAQIAKITKEIDRIRR